MRLPGHSSLIELLTWSAADALGWAAVCITKFAALGCRPVQDSGGLHACGAQLHLASHKDASLTLAVRTQQSCQQLVGLVPAMSAERRSRHTEIRGPAHHQLDDQHNQVVVLLQ